MKLDIYVISYYSDSFFLTIKVFFLQPSLWILPKIVVLFCILIEKKILK